MSARPGKLVRGVVKGRHHPVSNVIEFTIVVNDVDRVFAEGITPPEGTIVTIVFEEE